ncbi:hypothetical protein [Actinokineospora terrae]|uniref:Uncharacterized protein n=1 Tax=Actinokineospora terrae TaxID=155974 RepID=A0A1H9M9E5_9PSEU|nr:hypothetical protein [Actinokineospora terrae]SER20077.1 hypothetical protein SAMN04487818_10228 [Actinokineospora terrae]
MNDDDAGWHHGPNGPALRLGERISPVPATLALLLTGSDGVGLSTVPAVDILALETRLRRVVAALSFELGQAQLRLRAVRGEPGALPAGAARDRRGHLDDVVAAAIEHHGATGRRVANARHMLSTLRAWVIDLAPTGGWLHEAVHGWRRGPEPPAGVVCFAGESAYLDADPRRATATDWGGRRIDGVEWWGLAWRRDGDDDDPAAFAPHSGVDRTGPWAIGWVARTGELYAIRRSGHLPRIVWVLGTGVAGPEAARDLLDPLMPGMRAPNSVVLAADVIARAARAGAV